MHPPGCAHVCSGQCEGLGSTGCTLPESIPPGKAAWLQQEQSFCGHWLSGTLLVQRIQLSILAAGLRARRKFWGGSEYGAFVVFFLWLVGWVLMAFFSGL